MYTDSTCRYHAKKVERVPDLLEAVLLTVDRPQARYFTRTASRDAQNTQTEHREAVRWQRVNAAGAVVSYTWYTLYQVIRTYLFLFSRDIVR